jgi:uncharacterized membrane protein YgdD (TMEM256/DUF423 family)
MTSSQHLFLIFGALYGLIGVAAGAFGAHLLKSKLSVDHLQVFEVAVRYQMYHAFSLLFLAILMGLLHSTWLTAAGSLIIIGTAVFSGSLYLLVLTGVSKWGAVTPIGGLLLLFGWLCILLGGIFGHSANLSS